MPKCQSQLQQCHIFVHSLTTPILVNEMQPLCMSPSVPTPHPRYCCMNYKSSITGQNSDSKYWNLLPHSEAFILQAPFITDLGDASMLHRNKYTLFIHYFYCELETDFSFEIVWKGPNMRQQKASGSLQSHFFVSCQGVQQPPTIHSLTLPL